ncbi:MAG: serine hydrolase [Bacteroidales bacterium]
MKRKFSLGRLVSVFIIFAVLLGLFYLIAPKYVSRALIYQKVNIDDYTIFDNRKVKAKEPQPWLVNENLKAIPQHHLEQMMPYEPVAFLIVQDDRIVAENYWEDYSLSSYSNAFSSTKSIVSLLIGIAVDKGSIDSLGQAVGDFFPHYSKGKKAKITIRDLLTMSSGLNWDESYGRLFSTTTQAYYGENIKELVMELEAVEPSGQQFKYLSGNTQLLGQILSTATPYTMSNFASNYLWTPIGAEYDALWSLDEEGGYEKAYCCFNSNARDFARIGQLLLDEGRAYGKQVVSKDYIRQATTAASWLVDEDGDENDFYGYGWWLLNYKGKTVHYARGILGQYIFVLPDYDAVVVRLGHKRSDEYLNHHPKDVFIYLDAAFEMLN